LNKRRILVLGGARSGKSQFAQDLARRTADRVLFVATAEPLDEEMRQRIVDHQRGRPQHWQTLEAPVNVGAKIAENLGEAELVVVDCITLLASNLLTKGHTEFENIDFVAAEKQMIAEIEGIITCMGRASAGFIIVSNEVGLGLVPGTPLERAYRDILGRANQLLAKGVDEVYLLVAGIPIEIKSLGGRDSS
jgi:adenosylcobinamide kinase/adenosylcobinamide-phosphate guanylyltransferase